ncbi:unnamed protein product, partial [Mesorhabditis spiculigera]
MLRASSGSSRGSSATPRRPPNITRIYNLLESAERDIQHEACKIVRQQLERGIGIRQLVQHYAEYGSEQSVDMICSIREPYDTVLLDHVRDMLKAQKTTNAAIILLGQLGQDQEWVGKIATHDVFAVIIKFINRSHTRVMGEDIAALLFLSAFLPHCPILPEAQLKHLFDTFVNAAGFLEGKLHDLDTNDSPMDKVNVSHLQYAVREYFHTLYGIYPLTFVNHLRNFFRAAKKKNTTLVEKVMAPLLSGVRLHPNLLLMDKSSELSNKRWSRREAHDFLDDCRKNVIGLIPMTYNVRDPEEDKEHEKLALKDRQLRAVVPIDGFNRDDDDSDDFIPDEQGVEAFEALFAKTIPSHAEEEVAELEEEQPGPSGQVVPRVAQLPNTATSPPDNPYASFVDMVESPADPRSLSLHDRALTSSLKKPKARPDVSEFSADSLVTRLMKGVKKVMSPNAEKVYQPLVEVLNEVDDMEDPEVSPAEEAEETIELADLLSPEIEAISRERAESNASEVRRRMTGTMKQRPRAASIEPDVDQEISDLLGTVYAASRANSTTANYFDGVYAARESVRSSHKELMKEKLDHNLVQDRRLFTTPMNQTDPALNLEDLRFLHSGEDGAEENLDQQPVIDYHRKIPAELMTHCKNLLRMQNMEHKPIMHKKSQEAVPPGHYIPQAFPKSNDEMLQLFPYLELLTGPKMSIYSDIENHLENQGKSNRDDYMVASKAYHQTLKELHIADQLPGRIYDDLSHILQNLTAEGQKQLLQARLRLVNQHLFYERSTRLIHANRNRQLASRLQDQTNNETKIKRFARTEEEMFRERDGIIAAFKKLQAQEERLREKHLNAVELYRKKICEIAESNKRIAMESKEKDLTIEEIKQEMDRKTKSCPAEWRTAIDTQVLLDLANNEIAALKKLLDPLFDTREENFQLEAEVLRLQELLEINNIFSPDINDRFAKIAEHMSEINKDYAATILERDTLEQTVARMEEEHTAALKREKLINEKLRIDANEMRERTILSKQKFLSKCEECDHYRNELMEAKLLLQEAAQKSSMRKEDDDTTAEEPDPVASFLNKHRANHGLVPEDDYFDFAGFLFPTEEEADHHTAEAEAYRKECGDSDDSEYDSYDDEEEVYPNHFDSKAPLKGTPPDRSESDEERTPTFRMDPRRLY